MQQKSEKDPLSFTSIEDTAHNPPSTTIRPHIHHHQDHLPPSTTTSQRQTTLSPTYNHPVPKSSQHPQPRYDETTKSRRDTCQTIPTSSNNQSTTGRHNFPADTLDSNNTVDSAIEFDQTTKPNLWPIPTTPELPNHRLHSPNHPESAPKPTHSSFAMTPITASSTTIRHDLSEQQNQAIWDNYHAIQKQIADIQATLQVAIDLLRSDRTNQILPEATTQPHPPSDHPHPTNCDPQSLTDASKASQIPTILLFDITNIYSLLPRDPISLSTTAHHWSNCKRSSSQSPSFDFLRINETTPNIYLPGTPTDILHKLWHSNLVLNTNATTNVWPSIWQNPNTHNLPIPKVLSPNCYNCDTTTVAITAPYSLDPTCSTHIYRPPNILMTEIPSSTTTTDPLQHPRNDLRFHWYIGLGPHIKTPSSQPLPSYSTDHSIRHSATLLYFRVRDAPATAITTTAYLPALATKFRTGPRNWITTWPYGKHRTDTPLPATSDKNLLRPP